VIENRDKKDIKELYSGTYVVKTPSKKKYSINYLDFCLFISLLNKFNQLPISNGIYRAYVGKGNNSILIKNTLKARFWWNISENDSDANFNWQQSRDNKLIETLKSTNQKSFKRN